MLEPELDAALGDGAMVVAPRMGIATATVSAN